MKRKDSSGDKEMACTVNPSLEPTFNSTKNESSQ